MTRARLSAIVTLGLAVAAWITVAGVRAASLSTGQSQSVPSTPARLAEMQHHFTQVMRVQEAVIRGDLAAVRAPARELADSPVPSAVAASSAASIVAIRQAGQRAAEAMTIGAAAKATVAMVAECANCHRAVGIFPTPSVPATSDVGGLVGHMLEHQRATDELLQGLMIPSESQWRQGVERLRVAALRPKQLPRDKKLTGQIRTAEDRVHQIADQAAEADTPQARAASYVALLTSCAECHRLHGVWGPRRDGKSVYTLPR